MAPPNNNPKKAIKKPVTIVKFLGGTITENNIAQETQTQPSMMKLMIKAHHEDGVLRITPHIKPANISWMECSIVITRVIAK
mmetsp:Transcript_5851/g.12406  ORF Transcript_5851/g.12406 Transcript_5851/m.12406 type:complete len:82 (+) Transcript_5851:571-816(+)